MPFVSFNLKSHPEFTLCGEMKDGKFIVNIVDDSSTSNGSGALIKKIYAEYSADEVDNVQELYQSSIVFGITKEDVENTIMLECQHNLLTKLENYYGKDEFYNRIKTFIEDKASWYADLVNAIYSLKDEMENNK